MRVLVVPPTMDVGGAERVALDLIRASAGEGLEVALAAPPGALDAEPLPANVRRIHLPPSGRDARGVLATARALARAIRSFRPHVTHAHNPRAALASLAGTALAGRSRSGLVVTHHGVDRSDHGGAARILRAVPLTVCVSDDLREEVIAAGLPPARCRVIENGVFAPREDDGTRRHELDAELGISGRRAVSLVGRLVPQKAVHRYLEAVALIDPAIDVAFLVVGDGPLRGELERRAEDLGVAERVTFTGVRPDARELIARSELLVFTSEWEGLSIAALEALAAGVPVVSSGVAGMRELLGTGAGAIVAESAPPRFARCIEELLADEARREAMGTTGRALIAERFSIESMASEYARLYRAVARS